MKKRFQEVRSWVGQRGTRSLLPQHLVRLLTGLENSVALLAIETTTLFWAPPMGRVHRDQEKNEIWHHGGGRQTRHNPGYGVGYKGRK